MGFYGSSLKGEALSFEKRCDTVTSDLKKLMIETDEFEKMYMKEDLKVEIQRLKETVTMLEKAIERA